MGTRFLMAVLPVWLLVPAADGQEPTSQPAGAEAFECPGAIHVESRDGVVRAPASVEMPAGATATIDVMVVMSRERATDRPDASAREWVEAANRMHLNSLSAVRLRFVGWVVATGETGRMMDEFERGGDSTSVSRRRLLEVMSRESDSDRRRVGADVVVGVGYGPWTPQFAGWAFGYSGERDRAMAFVFDGTRSYTPRVIAHEIGHLLGLGHHDGAGAYVSYGRGYLGSSLQTIMATSRFLHYSSSFSTTGEVKSVTGRFIAGLGDADHDSVRAMRLTAQTVAAYEPARTPPPDPEPEPEPDPTPEPEPDEAPCRAAGEGLNLDGHQLFMCIVVNGEVQQLTPHRLSSRSMLFGRVADPKAVVKLVRSCQWGAVAAVVTARKFQIRVHNTANGKEWLYNHNTNTLAPSSYSGDALCD